MRSPPAIPASTAGIKSEIASLVRAMILIKHPGCSIPPETGHAFCDPGDRPGVILARAEVVCRSETGCLGRTGHQFFRQANISVDGFENMLPRTNGMRTTNTHWLSRQEAA